MPRKRKTLPVNEGAISPALIIIGVIIIAVIGGGLYLYQSGSLASLVPGIPGMSALPRVSESDFADVNDPLVRKHLAAQANTHAFRIKSTSPTDKGSMLYEIKINGASSYNYHMLLDTGAEHNSEMIAINDTTYVKDFSDNKWWMQKAKPQTDKETPENDLDPKKMVEEMTAKKPTLTYTKLGEEACGSLTCYKYEEKDSSSTDANRIFWFDTSEYLLRKEETGSGENKSVTEYSYDNIAISAPSPTKPVPEGKSAYEYLYGAGTMPEMDAETTKQLNEAKQQMQNAPSSDTTNYYDDSSSDTSTEESGI